MISLGAGAPSSAYFPFQKIQVQISNTIGHKDDPEQDFSTINMTKYDFQPDISDYSMFEAY
jgi:hypothetical protein